PTERVVYQPGPVQTVQIQLAFPAPAASDPDYPAFAFWADLLAMEEGAPLNRALRGGSPPVALRVSTELELQAGWSTFTVRLTLAEDLEERPGGAGRKPLKEQVQQALERTLQALREAAQAAPDPAQIRRALTHLKVQEYSLQEKLHYYGMMKAPLLALAGYSFVGSYLERVSAAQPEELQRAARKVLSAPPYLAVVVHPPGRLEEETEKGTPAPKGEILPPKGVEVVREVLANGLTVIARGNSDTRVFAVHLLAKDRASLELPEKAGAAEFLSRMLLRGTQTRTTAQISQALADIGAQVKVVDDPNIPYDDLYTSPAYAYIRFETIDEHADAGLDLLADLVRRPAFPPEEMERVRQELRSLIASQRESPSQTARQLLYAELFKGHPFSRDLWGTEGSISGLTREDLQALHRQLFAPNNLILALEGNLPAQDMIAKVALRFGDMEPVDHPAPTPPMRWRGGGERRVTQTMKKEQAALGVGLPLPGRESPEVPALQLMTSILSSRLASQLREVQGLAYAVGANAQFLPGFGWLQISLATTSTHVEVAREGILKEMKRMKEALVEEGEREAAINGAWGAFLMSRLSSINRAYYACLFEFLGQPIGYELGLRQRLDQVSPEEIRRAAQTYLDTENFVLAIAGGQ
ncbi:MAG: insulinase family protein, partial [Candidatus Tectomicrobia bacterium]|nr:insulinase family protein [Candidatus Tectomicrobia bacterium]